MVKNMPDWLCENEKYVPKNDHDNFINKTILSILAVISKIKIVNLYNEKYPETAALKFFLILLSIILLSLSRSTLFMLIMLAGILLRLCFFDGRQIIAIIKFECTALLTAMLFLIPSIVFMKNISATFIILLKISLSTTMMMMFSMTTQWNTLSFSFKTLGLPDIFIFIFDMTLKYIVLLGNLSLHMLTSLKLRSVGKNPRKSMSSSSILGSTFIKSQEMADDMFHAMECRGFTGEYHITRHKFCFSIFAAYIGFGTLLLLLYTFTR